MFASIADWNDCHKVGSFCRYCWLIISYIPRISPSYPCDDMFLTPILELSQWNIPLIYHLIESKFDSLMSVDCLICIGQHSIVCCSVVLNSNMLIVWLVVWNINFIFPYIGNFIIPTDYHMFQRGGPTSNQLLFGMLQVDSGSDSAKSEGRLPGENGHHHNPSKNTEVWGWVKIIQNLWTYMKLHDIWGCIITHLKIWRFGDGSSFHEQNLMELTMEITMGNFEDAIIDWSYHSHVSWSNQPQTIPWPVMAR